VSFTTITFCVASQRVFIVVVYFVIDSVRKLLDKLSYTADSNDLSHMLVYYKCKACINYPADKPNN
jgi:hypothetical protein